MTSSSWWPGMSTASSRHWAEGEAATLHRHQPPCSGASRASLREQLLRQVASSSSLYTHHHHHLLSLCTQPALSPPALYSPAPAHTTAPPSRVQLHCVMGAWSGAEQEAW